MSRIRRVLAAAIVIAGLGAVAAPASAGGFYYYHYYPNVTVQTAPHVTYWRRARRARVIKVAPVYYPPTVYYWGW